MKKIFLLISIQFKNFLVATSQAERRKKGKGGVSKLMLLVPFAAMAYLSISQNILFYTTLELQYHNLVLYMMVAKSAVACFTFGISQAQGHLFQFKDFDFLMSLPIKTSMIMISKMSSFYLIQLSYASFIMLPSIIIYGYFNNPAIIFYIYGIVGLLLLPVVPIIFASICAMCIRFVSGKTKYRNLISNVLSAIFFTITIFFISSSQVNVAMGDTSMFNSVFHLVEMYLPSVYYLIDAMLNNNIVSFLISIAINLVLGILYVWLFAKLFVKINSDLSIGYKVKNFKLKEQKSNSVLKTLFIKEAKKFFSNFMYVLNTSVGQFMLVFFAGYLVFNLDMVDEIIREFAIIGVDLRDISFAILAACILFCGHMSCPAGVSISLEGKHLWITKSLPIKTMDVFLSKMLFNVVLIALPSFVSFIVVGYVFRFDLVIWLTGTVLILGLALFVSLFGIIINLHFPKLEFDREIIVIKQSASAFLTVMGGVLMSIGLIMLCIYLNSSLGFVLMDCIIGITLIYVVFDVLLWLYLSKYGVNKFNSLYN